MSDDFPTSHEDVPQETTPPSNSSRKAKNEGTRAAIVWTFTVAAVLVLILLVIFMVQNQGQVTVYFLGFQGQLSLGISMLIAAVAGAVVVAISGAVRIIQLRSRNRTSIKNAGHPKP
ncbi:hypothetical protein CQ018_11895 [Arthrobacter sp. MYb227]|nr:hypothetical protein CQ018_11895 [Arthrobacter sp. MYb227]